MLFLSSAVWASDVTQETQPLSTQPLLVKPLPLDSAAHLRADQASYREWKFSLVPAIASQILDVTSSYGMREMNPMLAGPDGRFGARGAGIKLGGTAAIVGLEYLIARRHPHAARILSRVNWSISIATAGCAAYNFTVR